MPSRLLALNDDSIVYISSFLSKEDKWTLIRRMGNHMLINLTKKAKVKFHLTRTNSIRYHADELFRRDVQSAAGQDNGGQHVLSLYLRDCDSIVDASFLGWVHTLDLSGCTGIMDVSFLGGVHTLDLSGCSGTTFSFSNCIQYSSLFFKVSRMYQL